MNDRSNVSDGLKSTRCSIEPIDDGSGARTDRPAIRKKLAPALVFAPGSPMEQIISLVSRVARTDATVLLTGDSGTGKEIIARLLHENSPRKQAAFVPVNCGAIPDQLLESELFGHIKGAFTGAMRSRVGRFTVADEGTIFLDEIGEMPQRLQVKLLRVLQERSFEPVGSSTPRDANFRVIAATNQNLQELIQQKLFRSDLFYRLNVFPIHIPPLRDRRMDVAPLIDHFIEKSNKRFATAITSVSREVVGALTMHDWPGNVRELENTIQRMCILRFEGELLPSDLPSSLTERGPSSVLSAQLPDSGVNLPSAIESYERDLIVQALHRTSGNRSQAATLLGLNRTTLVEKIKRKDIAV